MNSAELHQIKISYTPVMWISLNVKVFDMNSNEQAGQPSEFNLKRLDRAMNNHSIEPHLLSITNSLKNRLIDCLEDARDNAIELRDTNLQLKSLRDELRAELHEREVAEIEALLEKLGSG